MNVALHHFTFPLVYLSTLLIIVLACSSHFHSLTAPLPQHPNRGGSKAGLPKLSSLPLGHGHKVQEFLQCSKKGSLLILGSLAWLINYQCSPPQPPFSPKHPKQQIKF